MALTFTVVRGTESEQGRVRERIYDVLLDNSYPAGGWPISPDDVGLLAIVGIEPIGGSLSNGAAQTTLTVLAWDTATSKLQAFESGAANAALAEKNEATGLNTTVARLRAIGY